VTFDTIKRLTNYVGMARDIPRIRRADDDIARQSAQRHLADRLGRLRGLPQKMGQMMSFTCDDGAQTEPFSSLQESADPLPLSVIEPIIEQQWNTPLDVVVADIQPHAHAASLGQVHRARLDDGRQVAIKVQYPGIRQAVFSDLKMLGWLSTPFGSLRRRFDFPEYRRVILENIERELDYCQEAKFQRSFYERAREQSYLVVPKVIDELSTEKVLVTAWEEGDHWSDVCDRWTLDNKKKLARKLLSWFFDSLWNTGQIHGDLHPGNLRFRVVGDDIQIVLYDFGCVHEPTDVDRLTLLRLIRATTREDESPWPLMLQLGFNAEYLEPLRNKLPALCKVLFEPFRVDYAYDMADWRLGERVEDILQGDRWNFRIAGPPSMVFLLRAFHSLKFYLEGLNVCAPWKNLLAPHLQRLDSKMNDLELPETRPGDVGFASLARHLKIRVRKNGITKVELTSYASGVDHLDELLDDDLHERITAHGINLTEVISDVRQRGYTPGPVFELEEADKEVHVWLE